MGGWGRFFILFFFGGGGCHGRCERRIEVIVNIQKMKWGEVGQIRVDVNEE